MDSFCATTAKKESSPKCTRNVQLDFLNVATKRVTLHRKLAQPARLLLAYVGAEYKDKRYVCQNESPYDRSEWTNVRETLNLPFPNLPYLIDGELRITQSNAILRYLGRKYNLAGANENDAAVADMLSEQIMDWRNAAVGLFYCPAAQFEERKQRYLEGTLPSTLHSFSKFLGDKHFLLGNTVTYPDFHFYELLSQHKQFHAPSLEPFPNLVGYMNRFEGLEKIKEYMSSNQFLASPINNPMANFK